MNDDTRKFFEKLTDSGAADEAEEVETKAVKASRLSKKEPRKETLKEELPEKEAFVETAKESQPDFSPDEEFEDGEGQLAIDVYQTPDEIVVESAVAGVSADNLDIEITSESVTITGRRQRQHRVRKEDYLFQECYWGNFSRSVILPQEVDSEAAVASIKNGILKIVLPKINKAKLKKLKVKFE